MLQQISILETWMQRAKYFQAALTRVLTAMTATLIKHASHDRIDDMWKFPFMNILFRIFCFIHTYESQSEVDESILTSISYWSEFVKQSFILTFRNVEASFILHPVNSSIPYACILPACLDALDRRPIRISKRTSSCLLNLSNNLSTEDKDLLATDARLRGWYIIMIMRNWV